MADPHELRRAINAGKKFQTIYPDVFAEMQRVFTRINLKMVRSMVKPHHEKLYAFLCQPGDQHGNSLRLWAFIKQCLPTPCPRCGGEITRWVSHLRRPAEFCGHICSNKSVERRERTQSTCLKKYGVDNPSKSKKVVRKIRQVLKSRYGYEHALQNPKAKSKFKQTCLVRYGEEHPMRNQAVKERHQAASQITNQDPERRQAKLEKWQKTCLRKYGVRHHFQNPTIYEKMVNSGHAVKTVRILGEKLKVQGSEPLVLKKLEPSLRKIVTARPGMPELFYRGVDGKTHRYYPDARILTKRGNRILLEVKGEWTRTLDVPTLKRKYWCAVKWCQKNGYLFLVAVWRGKGKAQWFPLRTQQDILDHFDPH